MDSGNSGSMQSSSGGDEEYDSRPDHTVPAFLNPSAHFVPNPQPSLLSHHQNHLSTFFDPSSNYFQAFSQSDQPNSIPNSMLNLDMVRSRGLRSEPNCTDLGNLPGSSSTSQSFLGGPSQGQFQGSSSMHLRSVQDNCVRASAPSDQTSHVVRNSKKRTRASRRAPTTVLTTDTSNFRAMVQEFTGIPAPPFSGSSYSRRLDLFGAGSGLRSGQLETLGPLYPLRPSAQKVQPIPYASSSSSSTSLLNNTMVDAIATTTNIANNTFPTSMATTTNSFNSISSSYQLPSDLGLPKHQNVLNLQNPIFTFQPLVLQPPLPHSLNTGYGSAKSQASLPVPSLEELGMSHGLSGLPSHVASDEAPPLRSDNRWRDGNQDHLRSFNENYGNSQRGSSCKLNYSGSSEFHHHEKGLENVSTRGEGTVESWICPSD